MDFDASDAGRWKRIDSVPGRTFMIWDGGGNGERENDGDYVASTVLILVLSIFPAYYVEVIN